MRAVSVNFKCKICGKEKTVKVWETIAQEYNQYVFDLDCDEGVFCDCDEDEEEE